MIDLMTATGGTAAHAEPVRQARLLGGEAAGPEQGLGMRALLQQLGEAYHAAGQLPPNQELAVEAPATLLGDLPADTGGGPLTSGLAEVAAEQALALPVDAETELLHSPLAETAWPDQPAESAGESAQAAWPLAGNPQLEQVEQWLDEQRQLQARHGAAQDGEVVAGDAALKAVDAWTYGARPVAEQSGLQPAATLRDARAEAAVAVSDSQAGAPQRASNLQFEVLAQAVRGEDADLQRVTSRAAEPATLSALSPQPQASGAAPAAAAVEVRLQGPEARWGEQMLQALRDQVEMQVAQRSQQATIRLDPPELGSLNIQISHEQGKLSVHINAAQADVARLLGMLSERLRHELIGQNFSEVSVGVSSDAEQGGQGQRRQASHFAGESIAAAREVEQQRSGGSQGPASDILISV